MSLTGSRRVAVALTSTALMGLSALALPGAAGAAEIDCDPADVTYSVSGGSIKWGVKHSFRSYLAGPIAHGGWDLTGTTFEGAERGADGQFVWPIANGAASASNAVSASGTGSIRMHGHDGVLDTTLSNPTVVINGTAGEIKVDYRAKKPETFTPTSPYVWVEGTQATGATFSLGAAQNFQQTGSVTVNTTNARLSADLDAAMGALYGPGAEVDNVTLVLDITETCTVTDPGEGEEPGDGNPGDGNGTIPGDNNGGGNGGGIFGSLGNIFGNLGS